MYRQLLLPLTLLALAAAAGCSAKKEVAASTTTAVQPVAVKTAQAEARTVEKSIMVTGSLQPDETTTVSSEVPGRIASLKADFGQAVRKGEVVAQLDTQELTLQLDRARASLAQ